MSANICRGTATSAIWKIATTHPGVGEGVRFAMDSTLEGGGFEPSVPGHGELVKPRYHHCLWERELMFQGCRFRSARH